MRLHQEVFPDPSTLGEALAVRIADGIAAAATAGRRYVLGCPSGRSPLTTISALIALVRERRLDLSGLVIAMMDDYVQRRPTGQRYEYIPDGMPHSCRRFGREMIAEPLSAAARPGMSIAPDHLWLPDPADPADYDHRLAAAGGIDLFILATGATDGHVAFNPPGSSADTTTRIVQLAASTRQDNLVTFPQLRSFDEVPRHGVSVGIDTIVRHSKSAVMLVHGTDKAKAAERIANAEEYDPDWPATVVTECAHAELFVDKAALSGGSI